VPYELKNADITCIL